MRQRLLVYAVLIAVALVVLYWRTRVPAVMEIVVVGENVVTLDGETLALDELGERVAVPLQRDPRQRVQVRVDGQAPSTLLIPVLDVLARNGAADVQVIAAP